MAKRNLTGNPLELPKSLSEEKSAPAQSARDAAKRLNRDPDPPDEERLKRYGDHNTRHRAGRRR